MASAAYRLRLTEKNRILLLSAFLLSVLAGCGGSQGFLPGPL